MSGERYEVRPGPGGTRLAGHALRNEGRRPVLWEGWVWFARCECGAAFEVYSANGAKRWHAQHKYDVANRGGAS